MSSPNEVNVEIDKPPPYSPGYNTGATVNQYQQGAYQPAPQGYNAGYPPPGQPYNAPYPPASAQVVHQVQPAGSAQVIVVHQTPATGNCPVCRVGNVYESYTCCGICCAIWFFPIGLICCLMMRERRCSHCGALR